MTVQCWTPVAVRPRLLTWVSRAVRKICDCCNGHGSACATCGGKCTACDGSGVK